MYSTTIPWRADLLVTDEDGSTQLLVETKKETGVDISGAAQSLRNQVASVMPDSYFLFVSTQRFWLWIPKKTGVAYEGKTDSLLAPYIDLHKLPLNSLSGREFELLVYSWLGSVIFKPAETLLKMSGQEWLVTTGLHHLIYRGHIRLDAKLH